MGQWIKDGEGREVWHSQQASGAGPFIWHISTIPPHMMEAIRRYIDHGVKVGGFLQAVINHDLFDAFALADEVNSANLYAFVDYFHNEAPSVCHGSRAVYAAWVAKHAEARGDGV